MKIENHLSEGNFRQYYAAQKRLIETSLSELGDFWEHADQIRALLEEAYTALEEMAEIGVPIPYEDIRPPHARKIEKYTTWIEVLRLTMYQYGRYSNLRHSVTEGLYSTLLALAAQHSYRESIKTIAVLGCGPGRSVLDLALAYPDAQVIGMDYSLLSLVVANRILGDFPTPLQLPFRDVRNSSISSLMTLPSFSLQNCKLCLCDLTEKQSVKADLIICSNTVNLLPDHEEAIHIISDMLEPDGVIVFADLVGWRLDRKPAQTVLRSDEAIAACFLRHDITLLESFSGGPYVEQETPENYTIYHEHFFVGKKVHKI